MFLKCAFSKTQTTMLFNVVSHEFKHNEIKQVLVQ